MGRGSSAQGSASAPHNHAKCPFFLILNLELRKTIIFASGCFGLHVFIMASRDLLLALATCGVASAARLIEMQPQQPGPIAAPVTWVDALTLGVGGRPFAENTGNFTYARMPPSAQPDLNPGEWFWSSTSSVRCEPGTAAPQGKCYGFISWGS